jgi:hypothetical protein
MIKRHSVPHANPRPVSNKDYSNTAFSGGREQQSNRLHGRAQEIIQLVTARLDAGQEPLTTDEMAEHFRMTPATLRLTLRAPVDLGLITVRQGQVIATAKLQQLRNPNLNGQG